MANKWTELNWTIVHPNTEILPKLVLPSAIHSEQTGYLKGRYIGENVWSFFAIIDYLYFRMRYSRYPDHLASMGPSAGKHLPFETEKLITDFFLFDCI